MDLHALGSVVLFLVRQFFNNLKDLNTDDMEFGEKKDFFLVCFE